jgi:hypothetical protein
MGNVARKTRVGRSLGGLTRARRRALITTAAALSVLGALIGAGPASAGLHKEFAVFKDCPVNTPGVVTCVVSTTTGGEFHLGSKTVPVSKEILLQGGLKENNPVLVPAEGGETLSRTPLQVPGGIVGIELLPTLTEVTATAELAGPVELTPSNAVSGKGVAASLPLKVKLDNPVLGASCRVGSDSEPVALNLTTGTTNPPPPNTPISGSPGKAVIQGHGKIVSEVNSSLVDNAFAAPGVNGCAEPLSLVIDPLVDLQTGLPAAAGTNTAIMNGGFEVAGSRSVVADRALPEVGRCVVAESEKTGKTTSYKGGYVDSGCIEESLPHFGKYEWLPGPGASPKFAGKSAALLLETTGGKKVKCASSTSEGEYTGPKSATVGLLALHKCAVVKGASCQTAGAGSGEITATGLQSTLGFIKDAEENGEFHPSVGWDLTGSPSIVAAECGASKESLVLSGSVIAPITTLDKMAAAFTLKYTQTAGKQAPEAFEEEPNDTLSASFGGGSGEQTGLAGSVKDTNGEKLEVKAETEE